MTVYENAKNTASKLLIKFGQDVTHIKKTAGAYDPATGSSTVTSTTQTIKAALFDYGSKEIDGTLVIAGDKKALVASKDITAPAIDDTLTVGSVVWTIKSIKELNPAGTSVMYELQVRK